MPYAWHGHLTDRKHGRAEVGPQLLKAQDTIPICPPVMSQKAALGALKAGRAWVVDKVDSLAENKETVRSMLTQVLGADAILGDEQTLDPKAWRPWPQSCRAPQPEVLYVWLRRVSHALRPSQTYLHGDDMPGAVRSGRAVKPLGAA